MASLSTCRCRAPTRSCLRVFRHECDKCGEHATAQSVPDRSHLAQISTLESVEIATCADRKDLPCALQIALPDTGHHKHGDGEGGLLLGMSGNSGSVPPAWHEVWTAPGWVIYPELTMTSVETANPGYGLHGPQTSADGKWY